MLYIVLFCIILLAAVSWYVYLNTKLNSQYSRYVEWAMRQVPGFQPAQVFVPTREQTGIGIDPACRLLCIAESTRTGQMPPLVLIPFADIAEVAVDADQQTLQRSARAQSFAGAAAGTIAAGPLGMVAGAIIGAAGGRRITAQVSSIAV